MPEQEPLCATRSDLDRVPRQHRASILEPRLLRSARQPGNPKSRNPKDPCFLDLKTVGKVLFFSLIYFVVRHCPGTALASVGSLAFCWQVRSRQPRHWRTFLSHHHATYRGIFQRQQCRVDYGANPWQRTSVFQPFTILARSGLQQFLRCRSNELSNSQYRGRLRCRRRQAAHVGVAGQLFRDD